MRDSILGLINPLIALIFAGIFFAIWLRDRSRREVAAFSLAYAFLGVGFLWSQLAPMWGGRAYLNITNILYFMGSVSIIWGATRRVGKTIPFPAVGLIGATMFILIVMSSQFHEFTNVDLYIANTAYGLLYLFAAQATAPGRKESVANALVFWMLVATTFQFFVRPSVSFMLEGALILETYRQSVYYSVLNAVVALNSLGLAAALITAAVFDRFQSEREAAACDPLSGILSRRAFEAEARAMLERASAEDVPLALVVGDIDHFKRVNDIWGHQVGDRAIAGFGSLVARAIRDYDVAGRIGGEEFCILVWNADEQVAGSLAERLRMGVSCLQVEGMKGDVRLTASFGAAGREEREGYRSLFKRADNALYRAKNGGRNRVVRAGDAQIQEDRREVARSKSDGDRRVA